MVGRIGRLLDLPSDWWEGFVRNLPGELGFNLRYRYWKKRLKYLGKEVRFSTGVYFQNPDHISIDDNAWIDQDVVILAGVDLSTREKTRIENPAYNGEPGVVHIGRNVHVSVRCIISGISGGVFIADNCGLAADCKIYALSHSHRSKANPRNKEIYFTPMAPQENQCLVEGPVNIAENAMIALQSVILPGVSIPKNCFLNINSVVNSRVECEENSILSGNPATVTGKRFKEDP